MKTQTTQDQLQDHVNSIAETLSNQFEGEGLDSEEYTAYDYLEGVLDINYILNADKTFKSARILVAFGGPNIWVDFENNLIEGFWWNDYAKAHFTDENNVLEALEEIFYCG